MNRIPKEVSPPKLDDIKPVKKSNYIEEIRQYKLITPLYGGGEEPAKPDSVTVIRGSEVRGHLRFWWRAIRGGQEKFDGKLEKMKEEEERIWGSAAEKDKAGASSVKINIINSTKGTLKDTQKKGDRTYHIGDPRADWGYVAFPLRDKKGVVYENIVFDLEMSYPDTIKEDVEIALWAWETFGGIGARTRRGLGALQLVKKKKLFADEWEDAPRPSKSQLENQISEYVKSGNWSAGIPHLNAQKIKLLSSFGTTPIMVWEGLSKKLKDFRQDRNGKFGRSKWPEPDSIRQILNDAKKYKFGKHKPEHLVKKKFPRAKFGLPIRFEFPVLPNKPNPYDPDTTTLQGKKLKDGYIDRLASPLLFRPFQCSDGVLGVAVVLDWKTINSNEAYTPPGGLTLGGNDYGDFAVESNLDHNEAKNIPVLSGTPDVLQAFLNFLDKQGGTNS